MKKRHSKKSFSKGVFLLLLAGFIFFGLKEAHAAILAKVLNFSNVFSIFSKNKTSAAVEPYVDITPFLLKPSSAGVNNSSTSGDVNVREDGVFLVQTGSMRVSTEKEKPSSDTISIYEVKKGDTLDSIAKLFNINKNTIIWANDLAGKSIKTGDSLLIFPMDGLQYTVKNSGTVEDIAKKYKVDAEEVAAYNGMSIDTKLAKGDTLFIPDAEAEIRVATKSTGNKTTGKASKTIYKTNATNGYFMMPVVGCVRTQGLHGPYSTAVDYGCKIGTQTVAAAGGTVLRATAEGYNGGYGGVIIISHPNKTQTIYSHMNTVNVSVGQTVEQGQVIGTTGNTGRSTGPHLHFETRGTGNPF